MRYLYRHYHKEGKVDKVHEYEGGGPVVYQDISTDGGQTWRLCEKVFEANFHSNDDVAYLHPDTHELFCTYKIRKADTYLIRSSQGRMAWAGEGQRPRIKARLKQAMEHSNLPAYSV